MTPLEAFTAWFTNQGGHLHPAVEFASTRSQGYILRVNKSHTGRLPRDTTVISCPHALSLSALNAVGRNPGAPCASSPGSSTDADQNIRPSTAHTSPSQSVAVPLLSREPPVPSRPLLTPLPDVVLRSARPQCVATIWLCAHYLLGVRSPWHAYISILPRPPATEEELDLERGDAFAAKAPTKTEAPAVIDTAMWWGDEEKSWVRGTNLARGIEDLEGTWRGEWGRFGGVFGEWARENGLGLGRLDWSLFKWAVSVYGSRAFSSALLSFAVSPATGRPVLADGDPHALLYPGADMLNHNHATKNRWFCDAERFGIICEDEPGPGEQVWNSYGKKGNAELLLSFGFSLQGNDCDAFALKLPPAPRHQSTKPSPQADVQNHRPPNTSFNTTTSASRLPASTRFPSPNADSNSTTNNTTTYKTLSLDETDTLESHDPDNNIYYVRRPASTAISTHPTSQSPLLGRPRPGYPTSTNSDSLAHLSGFPVALLEQLASLLANSREAATTTTQLHPHEEQQQQQQQHNTRLELAISALLLSRLEMEGQRLATLLATLNQTDDADFDASNSPRATNATRKHHARTYLQSQLAILAHNTAALRRRALCAIAGPLCPGPTAEAAQRAGALLALPATLACLRGVAPELAGEFVAGVFGGGADEGAICEAVDAMRRGEDEREEEDVFVLLVGALYVALFCDDDAAGERGREMRGWEVWREFGLGAAAGGTGFGEEGVDEAAGEVLQAVEMIRDAAPGMKLWEHEAWTRQGFARSCVQIVTEETVSVRVRQEEYNLFTVARNGDSEALIKYLRDDHVQHDVTFDAGAEELRVVFLYASQSAGSS